MPKNSSHSELLVKNWEIVQEIMKGLSDNSWKIKGWGATLWWAVVGYAVTAGRPELILALLFFVPIIFVLDSSQRIMHERFLLLNHDIEQGLTAIAQGDDKGAAKVPISTNVDVSGGLKINVLFSKERASFWSLYVIAELLTFLAYILNRA